MNNFTFNFCNLPTIRRNCNFIAYCFISVNITANYLDCVVLAFFPYCCFPLLPYTSIQSWHLWYTIKKSESLFLEFTVIGKILTITFMSFIVPITFIIFSCSTIRKVSSYEPILCPTTSSSSFK